MRRFLANIMAALSSLGGMMELLKRSWERVANTRFGNACGYAALAFTVPAAMLIGDPLTGRGGARLNRVLDGVDRGVELASRAALSVAKNSLSIGAGVTRAAAVAASDLVKLPFNVLGAAGRALGFGPRNNGQGSEQAAADNAAQRTAEEQTSADAESDARVRIQSVRRIASAIRKGVAPPEDAVASLPKNVVAYLRRLTATEAGVLVTSASAPLRALLDKGIAPSGVRSPQEVADGEESAPGAPHEEPAPIVMADRIRSHRARRNRTEELVREYANA